MTVPALAHPNTQSGLQRGAALMRALGSQGNAVWAELSTKEATQLTAAMAHLPEATDLETQAAHAFVRELTPLKGKDALAYHSVWQRLSALDGPKLASLLAQESPQIIAVTLSYLEPRSAADAVRALPKGLATEALKRLLNLGSVQPVAQQVIETKLSEKLNAASHAGQTTGDERVARIFDSLSDDGEDTLLSNLDRLEPGAGERVRALMFTFNDIATLKPAGIQTLLSHTDRSVLTLALKGADSSVTNAFLSNMTSRAREVLTGEVEALGPARRSDVEQARQSIAAMARTLARRGEIMAHDELDELVE